MKPRINDGLDKFQRYRLKDLDGYRKRKRDWARTPEQRAVRTAYMQGWREKNRARHNELARLSHHKNKHKHTLKYREYHLRAKYGIGIVDYEQMLARQNGKCFICLTDKPARNRFHVDHNHKTGRVRALLCSRCNGALGWFEKYRKSIVSYTDTVW